MDNSNLKQLLKEYEQKRLIANQKANQKKQELYQLAPRLLEIEQELNKNAISTTLSLLNSNEPQKIENLKEKIQDLEKQIKFKKRKNYYFKINWRNRRFSFTLLRLQRLSRYRLYKN